jgi:hypothetical protein
MVFSTSFVTFVATAFLVFTSSVAAPSGQADTGVDGDDALTALNHFGAPLPPWEPGSQPGWFFGSDPEALGPLGLADTVVDLTSGVSNLPTSALSDRSNDLYFISRAALEASVCHLRRLGTYQSKSTFIPRRSTTLPVPLSPQRVTTLLLDWLTPSLVSPCRL